MTASNANEGILRSRPRYSSASISNYPPPSTNAVTTTTTAAAAGSCTRLNNDDNNNNDNNPNNQTASNTKSEENSKSSSIDAVSVTTKIKTPTPKTTTSTIPTSRRKSSMEVSGFAKKPPSKKRGTNTNNRSLASLVQSSINLNAGAIGIVNGVDNDGVVVVGNVISHKPSNGGEDKAATSTISSSATEGATMKGVARTNHSGEVNGIMPILHISEEGTPYLKSNISTATPSPSPSGGGGTEAVDANDVIALGVMGDDGQHVRFCEYNDDGYGDNSNRKAASGRDRLEEQLDDDDVECDDDNDALDETGEDEDEGGVGTNDYDGNSSGSDRDDEIWEELGLSELIMSDDEYDDEQLSNDADEKTRRSYTKSKEELRTFRILWELLTRWATPSTIELVLYYQGKQRQQQQQRTATTTNNNNDELPRQGQRTNSASFPNGTSHQEEKLSDRNDVDIGASRMASIMSMIKMNTKRSLSELRTLHAHRIDDTPTTMIENGCAMPIDQRRVEQRLADLVRTFDPTAPAANLNMKLWRGLTIVLIGMVIPSLGGSLGDSRGGGSATAATTAFTAESKEEEEEEDGASVKEDVVELKLPPSIQKLNVSMEEYRYLTTSAIVSLSGSA